MLTRPKPARIVAVCVSGRPASRESSNAARFELMALIAREISRRKWRDLDAVLFPAGFIWSDVWFGPLHTLERYEALDSGDVGDAGRSMARKLSRRSPGCHVIVGIDTRKPNYGFRGDQLVAAFDHLGATGTARKIFPVDGDTNGWGRAPYLLFDDDPGDPARIIALPSGAQALLSVCYDAFVLAELEIGPTAKRRALRYFSDWTDAWRGPETGETNRYLARLDRLIATEQPTINLVAIHGFERPGRELRWQRHGIATASAALGGALTVGAGHYNLALPHHFERQPLASAGVAREHLGLASRRPAATHSPSKGFFLTLPGPHNLRALVRLYAEP